MRYDHRQIFNQLMSEFGYSAKQIAVWSDIHESKLSRFRTGKLDLEVGEFFGMLERFPQEAQDYFWEQLLGKSLSIEQLIKGMDSNQVPQLLRAIAAHYPTNRPSRSEERLAV